MKTLYTLFMILFFSAHVFAQAGSLDSTFGVGGKVTTDFGVLDYAEHVTIDDFGKIIAVGGSGPPGSSTAVALARYNDDGSSEQVKKT